METLLTAERLKALSEFPAVASKDVTKLGLYVTRAHSMAESYGPFPLSDDLSTDEEAGETLTEQERFLQDMEIALFLVAERIVLSAAAVPSQAAGFTSEKIGDYSYSRAQGASTVGEAVNNILVPKESTDIFERWRVTTDADEDIFRVERTDVFEPTLISDADDPGRKVVVSEDFGELAPGYLGETTGRGY